MMSDSVKNMGVDKGNWDKVRLTPGKRPSILVGISGQYDASVSQLIPGVFWCALAWCFYGQSRSYPMCHLRHMSLRVTTIA